MFVLNLVTLPENEKHLISKADLIWYKTLQCVIVIKEIKQMSQVN